MIKVLLADDEPVILHSVEVSIPCWRLDFNQAHRGDLYPTHGFGPVCQVLDIHRGDRLKTLVAIPESYLPRIRKGMSLQLVSDVYPDRVFPASVEVVYPTIDAATHTFQAKVVVPNKEDLLRPGMYVKTTISVGQDQVITAPYSTVLKLIGANDRYVFIHKNGRAQRVSVEMGDRFGDDVEISAPEIHDGVELITQGESRLVDSVKVEVKATHQTPQW